MTIPNQDHFDMGKESDLLLRSMSIGGGGSPNLLTPGPSFFYASYIVLSLHMRHDLQAT